MPITITIPTALRQFSDQCSELELEARTVGQALVQLTTAHPELRHHLYRNGNELRNFINVYVNDEDVRHLQGLDSPVKEGDVITIVPSIAGGAIAESGAITTASKIGGNGATPPLSNAEISRYSRHLIMSEVGKKPGCCGVQPPFTLLLGRLDRGDPEGINHSLI